MGALQNVEKGQYSAAWNDIRRWVSARVNGAEKQFPALANLVARLTSDEGEAAEQVAQDAYTNWKDGVPLMTIAENAAAEAAAKGITVAVDDVADWLGIIDRNKPPVSVVLPTTNG